MRHRTCHNAARDSGRRARDQGAPRSHRILAEDGSDRRTGRWPGAGRWLGARRFAQSRAGGPAPDMLRLLQTSDVHLGARHPLLGERAADQRRRQFEAFERTVDLAASTPVELFIIAGDLFDSSVQPRASMERVGAALGKLVAAGIPTILIPGGADAPGRASIYHAYDLAKLSGGSDIGVVEVLTPEAPDACDPGAQRAPDLALPGQRPARRRLADRHRPSPDPTARRRDRRVWGRLPGHRRAASRRVGPSGHRELGRERPAGARRPRPGGDWGRPVGHPRRGRGTSHHGAPGGRPDARRADDHRPGRAGRPGRARRDHRGAGRSGPHPRCQPDWRLAGRARHRCRGCRGRVSPTGSSRSGSATSASRRSAPGRCRPNETIAGAFLRDLEGRIAETEAAGDVEAGGELREALRIGRRLLAGRRLAR